MIKNVEMVFQFKNTIPRSPQSLKQMYSQATSNDEITVNTWRPIWIANVRENKKRFGNFKDHGVGQLFGLHAYKPAIVVGSGPSLKNNIEELKKVPKEIPIISCLHNYQYMVDNGVRVDFFVSLDAGAVVIEEISEGGKLTHDEYVESTKDKTLIAFIGSNPKLFENWKGKVYLFNCPVPDDAYNTQVNEIEEFHTFFSTGGNVLGAATYLAKAIFGCNPICFLGADFSFSYTHNFHAWNSKYDGNLGEAMRAIDVWGNSVLTWPSYHNFKVWFDWLCESIPGIYINCTEGGLLGSYPEGNIASVKQMFLKDFIWMYTMHEEIRPQCENPVVPKSEDRKILF